MAQSRTHAVFLCAKYLASHYDGLGGGVERLTSHRAGIPTPFSLSPRLESLVTDLFNPNSRYTIMNTQLQNFSFNDALIRVIIDEQGNPWFIARDICDTLDIKNVSQACEKLDDDEKLIYVLHISGQQRDTLLVNESGLYSLILSSNKPEAKAFKKVVTSEILPSIRKTGQYSTKAKKQSNVHDVFLKSHRVARELFQDPQQRLNYALQYTRQQTGVDLLVEAGIQQTDLFLEGVK